MEEFNLSEWLKDKSRKVVTRNGRKVRIICTNCKSSALPIIAEIQNPKTNTWFIDFFNVDGTTETDEQKQRDLFFADEEDELTEFENELINLVFKYKYWDSSKDKVKQGIKKDSKLLLDLARKEIRKEEQEKLGTLEMPIDTTNPHYIKGKQDTLKDLESLIEDKVAEKFAELFGKLLMQPNPNQPNPFQPITVIYGCPTDYPDITYTKTQQDNE